MTARFFIDHYKVSKKKILSYSFIYKKKSMFLNNLQQLLSIETGALKSETKMEKNCALRIRVNQ